MTAEMPETVFTTDHQRKYLLSWNANNWGVKKSEVYCLLFLYHRFR